nr:hypothetical protein [Tanacetum cinerariifolium]
MANLEPCNTHNMVAYLQKPEGTTASTLDNGEMEINATIYGKVKDEGSTVPVEFHHTPIGAPSTSQPHLLPTPKSSIRQETEVPQPSSPPHTNVADEAASTGVDVRR